jgi:hypothetical protein
MIKDMVTIIYKLGNKGYRLRTIALVSLFSTMAVSSSSAQTAKAATACTIGGADSVNAGSSASYTLSSGAADTWTVTCGSVSSKTGNMVTLNFVASPCANLTITAIKNGQALATKKIIIRAVGALSAPALSNGSQTIDYAHVPVMLNAPAATGGNCDGGYTFQWLSSPDNTRFLPIAGANAQNYQPGPLLATSYFKRQTNCGGSLLSVSNSITVTVNAQVPVLSLNPCTQLVNPGSIPSALSLANIGSGNGTFSYTWQQSSNPLFTGATTIAGVNSASYTPNAIGATTYYRLVLMRHSDSLFSAPAVINVLPPLAPGNLSPAIQTIASGDVPALITCSSASGGDGNYAYQWYSSTDGNNWTAIDGVWSAGYNPSGLEATTWYRVVASSNGLSVTSSPVVIKVN